MPQSRLSGQQKLGLSVFVVIGLTTLILGLVQIRKNIVRPFVRGAEIKFRTPEEIEAESEAKLKAQDTDSDGMNDYDELYVFRTSPYLEDSDSDGINDGTEIASNTDPNCPKGKECRMAKLEGSGSGGSPNLAASGAPVVVAPTSVAPASGDGAYQTILETFGDPAALTPAIVATKLDAMSSDELRGFLVKMGIPIKALEKADDAMLKQMLEETMIEVIDEM
jgi:hypothetical protein